MNKLAALVIVSLCLVAYSAQAAVLINDPAFDTDFTDLGKNTFTQADSDKFDLWVYEQSTDFIPRQWDRPTSGGNPDGYADGAFRGNNYNRSLFQAVTDLKSTTGLVDLTFDLNLSDGGSDNGPLTVSIWGVQTLGSSFSLSTRSQAGVTADNAIILATQEYTADTLGWETQTIADIDLGTGYDLVIIGFWSKQHDENDPDIVGIDNVALAGDAPAVPEPASLAMGLVGLGLIAARRSR